MCIYRIATFFSFQNASELATTCSNGINLHITLLTILGNLLLSFELDINNYYSNSILQHIITRFYCYPYGGFDNRTIKLVKSHGFLASFTVAPNKTKYTQQRLFSLDRFDTTDFY